MRGAPVAWPRVLDSLVCPRCRPGGDAYLRPAPAGLACPACDAGYPVLDGVPTVVRDPGALPPGLPDGGFDGAAAAAFAERLGRMDPGSAEVREAALLGTYALAHFPECAPNGELRERLAANRAVARRLEAWLRTHAAPDGPALEVGAGPGGGAPVWSGPDRRPVVLSDIRPASVRLGATLHRTGAAHVAVRALGPRFRAVPLRVPKAPWVEPLVCDALDPPFAAGSFGIVAAMNLLDAIPEPWILLGQLDALLAPGGLLVLSLPYQQDPVRTPPAARIDGPSDLLATLEGRRAPVPWLDFRVLESEESLPWVVPANDRLVHEYRTHVVVARKAGS